MRSKNKELEMNQLVVPLQDFLESYNRSIPAGFPRATVKSLREFQTTYPLLFKSSEQWSIDKHRKRLMDWLSSHQDAL